MKNHEYTHTDTRADNELNKWSHPNLIVTYKKSEDSVNFLDLNVSLRNGTISIDLYAKSTDGHQYLHYKLPHPKQIKHLIPHCQALRLSRTYSSEKYFKSHG